MSKEMTRVNLTCKSSPRNTFAANRKRFWIICIILVAYGLISRLKSTKKENP